MLSRIFCPSLNPDPAHTMNTRSKPSETPDATSLADYGRFRRSLLFLVAAGLLFCAGQGVRLGLNLVQAHELENQNTALYVSALGSDIGQAPFGRLQFEYGKLISGMVKGLDPLVVLAVLSEHATSDLRVDALEIRGKEAEVRGFYGPESDGLDTYLNQLAENMEYEVTLSQRKETVGGIEFGLRVTRR